MENTTVTMPLNEYLELEDSIRKEVMSEFVNVYNDDEMPFKVIFNEVAFKERVLELHGTKDIYSTDGSKLF